MSSGDEKVGQVFDLVAKEGGPIPTLGSQGKSERNERSVGPSPSSSVLFPVAVVVVVLGTAVSAALVLRAVVAVFQLSVSSSLAAVHKAKCTHSLTLSANSFLEVASVFGLVHRHR